MMKEFEFTLKYKLADSEADPEQYLDALYKAGCDDALIGIGKVGSISFNFDREEECSYQAIISAMKDIKKVIPDATLIEASPDLVNATELSEVFKVSRQYIHKLMAKPCFPEPAHKGKQSLWHLYSIMRWWIDSSPKTPDLAIFEISKVNMMINQMNCLDNHYDSELFSRLQKDTGLMSQPHNDDIYAFGEGNHMH